jgi:hypothetical protein
MGTAKAMPYVPIGTAKAMPYVPIGTAKAVPYVPTGTAEAVPYMSRALRMSAVRNEPGWQNLGPPGYPPDISGPRSRR